MRERWRALWLHLKSEHSSPSKLAVSVFTGIFLGVVPLYGIQTGIVIFVAWLFRLNKVATLAAAQISMPFIAPFLLAGGLALGELMRFGEFRSDTDAWKNLLSGFLVTGLTDIAVSCMLGSIVLGLILGAIGGGVAYAVAVRSQGEDP